MWIFTNFGFFSAVGHRANPDILLIRARCLSDANALVDKYGVILGVTRENVIFTPNADYAYRVLVSRSAWAQVVAQVVNDIDYPNFKNSVYDNMGEDRYHLYGDVWSTMLKLQIRSER